MQEAGPAVLEEPDRQNGEGEQQDEDEQVGAVLPLLYKLLLLIKIYMPQVFIPPTHCTQKLPTTKNQELQF